MRDIFFNESTEADSVGEFCARDCQGKFIVITGCSVGGIGFEVARVLAKYGAEVFITCRTEESCCKATAAILADHPSACVNSYVLDLASFTSILRCADYILSLNKGIDVLINNAGTMEATTKVTEDGIEYQWQVNYLGPFYFTQLLLPALIKAGTKYRPSRVLMTSSVMNYAYTIEEGIEFDKLSTFSTNSFTENEQFMTLNDPIRRYAESKLANVLYAKELSLQMKMKQQEIEEGLIVRQSFFGEGLGTDDFEDKIDEPPYVIAVSLHPGVAAGTRLFRSLTLPKFTMLCMRMMIKGTAKIILKEKHKSISQAAATTVYCALHPSGVEAGKYYADCGVSAVVHSQADDPEAWSKLWEISESQIRISRMYQSQQLQGKSLSPSHSLQNISNSPDTSRPISTVSSLSGRFLSLRLGRSVDSSEESTPAVTAIVPTEQAQGIDRRQTRTVQI